MILQIFFGSLLLFFIIVRFKNRRIYALSRKLNNDILRLPFFGHFYMFLGNAEDRMTTLNYFGKKALDNGGLAALWLGSRLCTVVADAVAADYLMKTCLEKDDVTKFGHDLIGNGSVFAPVRIWRPRRKITATSFSITRLNNFVNIFSEQSSIMVKKLEKLEGKNSVPMLEYALLYSLDSVCESTLGVKVGAQSGPNHPFPKAFQEICQMCVNKIFQPYIYEMPFYKLTSGYAEYMINVWFARDFIKNIIETKRLKYEDKKKNKTILNQSPEDINAVTFLDMMLDTSGNVATLSGMEMLEESLVLILAGTDTSATGAAFVFKMLSRHPDVQDKVYQELQAVFGDTDRPVTAKDLTDLKYLNAVIKETLRLYPPVPVTIRKIDEDVTIPSGITLVEGTSLLIHNWALNRNPKFWGEDAEAFRPERFIDASPKHPAAFASFSLGPRACLGYKYALMSIATITATLVRNFKFLPCETSNISYENNGKYLEKEMPLRVKFELMMKNVDGFKVRLEARVKYH